MIEMMISAMMPLKARSEGLVPAHVRMLRAHDAHGKDNVDNVKEHDAGGGEDLRGDGEVDVAREGECGNAECCCRQAGHAESE